MHDNHTYKSVLSLYSRAVVPGRGEGLLTTASLALALNIKVEYREPNSTGSQRWRRFKGKRLTDENSRGTAKLDGLDAAELQRRSGPCCDCGDDNLARRVPMRRQKGNYFFSCYKKTLGKCNFYLSKAGWEEQNAGSADAVVTVSRKKRKTKLSEDVTVSEVGVVSKISVVGEMGEVGSWYWVMFMGIGVWLWVLVMGICGNGIQKIRRG